MWAGGWVVKEVVKEEVEEEKRRFTKDYKGFQRIIQTPADP